MLKSQCKCLGGTVVVNSLEERSNAEEHERIRISCKHQRVVFINLSNEGQNFRNLVDDNWKAHARKSSRKKATRHVLSLKSGLQSAETYTSAARLLGS